MLVWAGEVIEHLADGDDPDRKMLALALLAEMLALYLTFWATRACWALDLAEPDRSTQPVDVDDFRISSKHSCRAGCTHAARADHTRTCTCYLAHAGAISKHISIPFQPINFWKHHTPYRR